MKLLPDYCKRLTLLALFALGFLGFVRCAKAPERTERVVTDAGVSGFLTQVFRFHIGKCHLDSKDVSWFSGGRPELSIHYRYGGTDKIWTSTAASPTAKGLDFSFNSDVDLAMDLDPNAHIRIVLVDHGGWRTTTLMEKAFPVLRVRQALAGGSIKVNNSWCDVAVVDLAGRYDVQLQRTLVAPEDFVAIGGTLPKDRQVIHAENLLASPIDSFKRTAANLTQDIKESIEKCDHLIIIEQNGKVVFDSSQFAMPQGLAAAWDSGTKCQINWKPADKITIRFQDHNTITPNTTILEQNDNSDSSISLLQGPVYGGKRGQSVVFFCARRLEGK